MGFTTTRTPGLPGSALMPHPLLPSRGCQGEWWLALILRVLCLSAEVLETDARSFAWTPVSPSSRASNFPELWPLAAALPSRTPPR